MADGFEIRDISVQAYAGKDKTVMVGNPVNFFSGVSASENLAYAWSVDSAPEGTDYILSNGTSVNGALFVPATPGSYTLRLILTDENGEMKGTDTVTIMANTEYNSTPVTDAGADQTVAFGDEVMLDGFVTDNDPGDDWAYAWVIEAKPGGSESALTGGDTPYPSFTPDVAGTYTVSFTATDKAGIPSAKDAVNIMVRMGGGDVNGDNVVDLADAVIVLKLLSGVYVSPGHLIGIIPGDKIALTDTASILEIASTQP